MWTSASSKYSFPWFVFVWWKEAKEEEGKDVWTFLKRTPSGCWDVQHTHLFFFCTVTIQQSALMKSIVDETTVRRQHTQTGNQLNKSERNDVMFNKPVKMHSFVFSLFWFFLKEINKNKCTQTQVAMQHWVRNACRWQLKTNPWLLGYSLHLTEPGIKRKCELQLAEFIIGAEWFSGQFVEPKTPFWNEVPP